MRRCYITNESSLLRKSTVVCDQCRSAAARLVGWLHIDGQGFQGDTKYFCTRGCADAAEVELALIALRDDEPASE